MFLTSVMVIRLTDVTNSLPLCLSKLRFKIASFNQTSFTNTFFVGTLCPNTITNCNYIPFLGHFVLICSILEHNILSPLLLSKMGLESTATVVFGQIAPKYYQLLPIHQTIRLKLSYQTLVISLYICNITL